MDDLIAKAISGAQRKSPAAQPANKPSAEQSVSSGNNSTISNVDQRMNLGYPVQSLNQSAWTGEHGKLEGVSLNLTQTLTVPDFYFDISILEKSQARLDQEVDLVPLQSTTALTPGRTYVARVSVSLNRYQNYIPGQSGGWRIIQEPIKIQPGFRLFLEEKVEVEGVGVIKTIEGQNSRIIPGDEEARYNDFEITLQDNCPTTSVTLELAHYEISGGLRRVPTSVVIDIEGNYNFLPREIRGTYLLPVDAQPPEFTAFLHILPEDGDHIRFVAWVRDEVNRPLKFDSIVRPKLVASGENPSDYVKALQKATFDFSIANAGTVSRWLNKVVELYGEHACVIIVDQADSEVLWEMFKVNTTQYLGEKAVVVRWLISQYRGQPVSLQLEETIYTGQLASYVHPCDYQASLQDYPALCALVDTPYDSIEDFLLGIVPGGEANPIGLVYVSHDQMLVYGDEHDALRKFSDKYGSPVELRFDFIEGRLTPRPIFFVNTPFSGRVLLHGLKACGLAKAALTQVAAGYLGTLGPIEHTHAFRIAQQLLEAAARPGGINPAHFLRDLRREAVGVLNDPKISPAIKKSTLLNTFMYVYYGNPNARLHVLLPSAACRSAQGLEDE